MDFDILKIKGFNLLLYVLVGFQLILLAGIVILLISIISHGFASTDIVASAVLLFLLGTPLLILLYKSSKDRVMREVMRGLIFSYALLSASGIIWYILAATFDAVWLVSVAKLVMVCSYAPIAYALYKVFSDERARLTITVKFYVSFICLAVAAFIVYFSIAGNLSGNWFDTGIYVASTLFDILILGLAILLVLVYAPTRMRYLFSIVLIYVSLSFLGDLFNLIQATGNNVPVSPTIFYDAMLLFAVGSFLVYSFLREVSTTTVEEVNKKLDDTRHVMDDIIMQSPDAICIFNSNGDAILANDQLIKLFGSDRKNFIGGFNVFRHTFDPQCEYAEKIARVKLGETVILDRIKMQLPDKRSIYLSIKVFPTCDSSGSIANIVAFYENITARVQGEEELMQAKALVELYIDLMGHDINNMNQIGMGYIEMAINTIDVQGDQKLLLQKPLEAMANSSRLIDNVKKLRRASEDNMEMRPVDLGKVLKGVIAEYGQAPGRDINIDSEVAENTMVMANDLLTDVFANLVSNAIKHSSGHVRIYIGLMPVDSSGRKHYRVTVEDNGPGIPDDLKPLVFDRMSRSRSKSGGSGLGLDLARKLIESYGGSIRVEDRVPGDRHQGTRFVVMLPAAEK